MRVIEKIDCRICGNILGYQYWLIVDSWGANDCLLVDPASNNPSVARCHPIIRAEQIHADRLNVELGTLICGVRWLEAYNGQQVCNPQQVPNTKG